MGNNKRRVLVQSISISIDSLTVLFSRMQSTLTAAIPLLFVLRAREIANGCSMTVTHLGVEIVRSYRRDLSSFHSTHSADTICMISYFVSAFVASRAPVTGFTRIYEFL